MDLKGETINLGGTERVSRYELGEILCSLTGFDNNLLQKSTMDEIPNYPKVEDVSLNIDKLRSLGITPISIEESIKEILI
jgi:dTDP-4-dehydrorhamnose reductase